MVALRLLVSLNKDRSFTVVLIVDILIDSSGNLCFMLFAFQPLKPRSYPCLAIAASKQLARMNAI
jgi:hypothetical protein